MRKITIIIALLCSISAFSTRYLVQKNGTSLWNGSATGTIVTLGAAQTLNAWYSATDASLNSGDEIWLATGVYVTDGTITLKNGVSLYGGFAGTEATVGARSKGSNAWSFTNTTTIDGNNASRQGIITLNTNTVTSYIDGITITKYNVTKAAGNLTGIGASVMANWIMQNCIVTANTFTNSTDKQCRGAGVYVKGGQLLNSYIYNNSATKGTGSGSTYGGGVAFSSNATPATVVKGCTISNNTSTVVGGGIAILDGVGGTLEDCIIQFNTNTAGQGGGLGVSSATGTGNSAFSIKNCQFIENTSLQDGAGAILNLATSQTTSIEGCSFIGNIATAPANGGGGLYVSGGLYSPIKNCIFRNNKIASTNGGTGKGGSAFYIGVAATVQNCIIANNTTVANTDGTTPTHTMTFLNVGSKLLNSTIVNNQTTGSGAALSLDGKVSTLTNCVFWGNTTNFYGHTNSTLTYNATDGIVITGTGNINTLTSPSTNNNTFVNPTTYIGVPSTSDGDVQKAASASADWSLKSGCLAINTGT
ncbi:MAG: hypothetical protein ACOYMD_11750, partial [Paludibacter sp.]